ncbi:MAG: hypothetical protein ACREL5_11305 [Gemmatimonadales bacterium]
MTTRRDFLHQTTAAALSLRSPRSLAGPLGRRLVRGGSVDIIREPDAVVVQTDMQFVSLRATTGNRWIAGLITVTCSPQDSALRLSLAAPRDAIQRIHLRWHGDLSNTRLVLGDAWERAYGDLEWRGMAPDRVMPWYALAWDGKNTNGYGVRNGPAASCFWQLDPDGISLWADVRSGGSPLLLGERDLAVCDVVSREGQSHETPFAAAHDFCRQMCPTPRLPAQPVYGHNDWYYAYGNNSEASVLADAHRIVDLSPTGGNRPFAVIDDGWQPERGTSRLPGLWDRGNEKFPDMAALAARVHQAGARPGIWMRPLLAPHDASDTWRLSRSRGTLDPTVPDVLHKVAADIGRIRQWGYQLIKHDYSTWDIMGRWGRTMGSSLTNDSWKFAEGQQRTTAEVIGAFYRTIRDAAGASLVIGCNTVSHLSAGVFEICRIGDDTSGEEWIRVPRMGVNALAFRGAQQGAFYVADPDCVGVTTRIPWEMNRQWLDLLSRSGTTTFVSLAPDALGEAQRSDLHAALARAAEPQPLGEPLDWQDTNWPRRWRLMGKSENYDWVGESGLEAPG